MLELKAIQHSNISLNEIEEIIRIKSISWPYPYEKQIEWIDNHLKGSDFHLLLHHGNKIVAYLNLISMEITLDFATYCAIGVGNVCVVEMGKGYGINLMNITNQYIKKRNKIGLLFCKQGIINFYKKCGWSLIERSQLNLSLDNNEIITMIFNCKIPFRLLSYHGQSF